LITAGSEVSNDLPILGQLKAAHDILFPSSVSGNDIHRKAVNERLLLFVRSIGVGKELFKNLFRNDKGGAAGQQ
jgi:hypothetical protein